MQKRAIGVFAALLVVIPSIVLFGDSFRWIVERQVGILEGIFLAEAALLAAIIGVYLAADRDAGEPLSIVDNVTPVFRLMDQRQPCGPAWGLAES